MGANRGFDKQIQKYYAGFPIWKRSHKKKARPKPRGWPALIVPPIVLNSPIPIRSFAKGASAALNDRERSSPRWYDSP